MRRIIRKQKSAQILGGLLLAAGLAALFFVLWRASSGIPANSGLSALWSYVLNEQVDVASMVSFRMIYLAVMSVVFLGLGLVTLVFSRQIFYLSGPSVMLTCPYCRNSWKARRAMGWAEGPHCRKFIQPQVMKAVA